MKINIIVKTDKPESEVSRFVDVEDWTSDEEVSEAVREYALTSGMVSIDWQYA